GKPKPRQLSETRTASSMRRRTPLPHTTRPQCAPGHPSSRPRSPADQAVILLAAAAPVSDQADPHHTSLTNERRRGVVPVWFSDGIVPLFRSRTQSLERIVLASGTSPLRALL